MQQPHIPLSKNQIRDFCVNNHITKLSLFGSVLSNQFKNSSDVDFLVQFEKNNYPTLIGMAHMENELTVIIGRKADLRTAEDLSPYFRNEVIKDAYPLYEQ
jgi:predicted nucleotidyltransferase